METVFVLVYWLALLSAAILYVYTRTGHSSPDAQVSTRDAATIAVSYFFAQWGLSSLFVIWFTSWTN